MSQMAKGLVLDIAMKLVADESQDVINAVRDACETDAEAERRAGIYLFGSFESASANLQKLDAEIERIVNTAKSTFAIF
jgi:hypothetical protein